MKRLTRLLAICCIIAFPSASFACDICGCSSGAGSLGFLPLMQRHFIGIRWQEQHYITVAHAGEEASQESFRSMEIWGRWHPTKRLQVLVSMPYRFSRQHFDAGNSQTANGLGDGLVMAQYAVLNPIRQAGRKWQHNAQIGGGIKLPTGATDLRDGLDNPVTPAMQPGSGSTDFLLTGLYALRRGAWGLSLDATARFVGKNKQAYQFGNRINTSLRGFFTKKMKKTAVLPFCGLLLDARDADRDKGRWQNQTGGWASFGVLGAEIFRGNWSLGLEWQQPLSNDLSAGMVRAQPRFNASVTMLFGKQTK